MNPVVSIYNNKYDTGNKTTIDIRYIPLLISTPGTQIEDTIHTLRMAKDENIRTVLKGCLPMFTCAGVFSYREVSSLVQYSNFLALDFDHITTDIRRQQLKNSFTKLPFVYMVFESPNRGLKVVVCHDNTDPRLHKALFEQLHALPEFNVPEFDINCSDLTRTTFLSYDPGIYVNNNVVAYHFIYTATMTRTVKPQRHNVVQANKNLTSLVNNFPDGWTDKQMLNWVNNHFWKHHSEDYQEGHRKASLMRKAGRLCAWGVGYEAALSELMYRYTYKGLTAGEVQEAVDYCYSHNVFGSQRQEALTMKDGRGKSSLDMLFLP